MHPEAQTDTSWFVMIRFLKPKCGRSRISGKGVHMYNRVGICFADFISSFLNIPWKWNNLVSLRPNYFIFSGYLKSVCVWGGGGGREGFEANPLSSLWIHLCQKSYLESWGSDNCHWYADLGSSEVFMGSIYIYILLKTYKQYSIYPKKIRKQWKPRSDSSWGYLIVTANTIPNIWFWILIMPQIFF